MLLDRVRGALHPATAERRRERHADPYSGRAADAGLPHADPGRGVAGIHPAGIRRTFADAAHRAASTKPVASDHPPDRDADRYGDSHPDRD